MDVITDYGTFLREAKTAVLELRDMQQQEQQLLKRLKQDQKQLETDKKAVEDRISQTTKKRLGEITASYDKELSKGQDQLKKVRSKREKAKNQGVKERIIDETSDLRDDNRRIRLQIKTIFQQNHVPGICDTNLYYTLYFPRHFGEILKLFAAIVLVFLLLPYGIYWVLKKPDVIYLVGIYFAFILVFGGAYVLWGNKTRDRYGKVLKEGRLLRDEIHANTRKIKVITRNIRRDRNETIYDLQKYDDEIAQIEQEKGIKPGYMMEKITQALASAYKRDHEGAGDNIEVRADPEKGDVRMYIKKDVVETVDNPAAEISLEEAREKLPHAQLGDVVRIEVKTKNFGRIAAQTARQVIIQGIREAERGMVYDEFNSKEHEILTGIVTRIDPRSGAASLRIGSGSEITEAFLAPGEQVRGEDRKSVV